MRARATGSGFPVRSARCSIPAIASFRAGRAIPVDGAGVLQCLDVELGEPFAPALEPRLDLFVVEPGRAHHVPRVRRRCVAWHVRQIGERSVDLLERSTVGRHVQRVVAEQQRAVDVEQDEPAQSASTAARRELTYDESVAGPSAATSIAREPTTIPSASAATVRAWSGVEMPKPA